MSRTIEERMVAGLHVRVWPGTGQTVLALAGLGSSGAVWKDLAVRLPDAHIVAPDLRGRGKTPSSGATGLRGHARDLAAVAAALDLDDIVIVGHSMGAFLAPVAAQELGDRVERLVLVDGGLPPAFPFFMGPALTRIAFKRQLTKFDKEWPDVATFAAPAMDKALAKRPDLIGAVLEMLGEELVGEPGRLRPVLDTSRAVADAVDTFYGPDVVPALDALKVPAHLVLAQHSKTDKDKPFIADKVVTAWTARQPLLTHERLDANHVTVAFTDEVARAVVGT